MIKIEDYIDSQGQATLHKYKVVNVKDKNQVKIHLDLPDLFILKAEGECKGYIAESQLTLIDRTVDETALVSYNDSFTYKTTKKFFEPISAFENESFHIYSFSSKDEIVAKNSFEDVEFYYVDTESKIYYDWLEQDENRYYFDLSFNNVKALKNYDLNKIQYKFDFQVINENTETVELTLDSQMLISDLVFVGRKKINNKVINNYNATPKIKNDVNFFPHFMHLVNVQKDYVQWYDSFSNFLSVFNDLKLDNKVSMESLKIAIEHKFEKLREIDEKLFKNTFYVFNEMINKCIEVTRVLTSNFAGMGQDAKNKFKEEKYGGSSPQEYCNFQINSFLKSIEKFNSVEFSKTFEFLVLAFSKYISSNYCFKGGLTTEHELYLPFYASMIEGSGFVYLHSNYFYFDNGNWKPKSPSWLKHNSFVHHTNIITLPLLAKNLEESNTTNSPIDFNTKLSTNFSYLLWHATDKTNISSYMPKIIWNLPDARKSQNIEFRVKAEGIFQTGYGQEVKEGMIAPFEFYGGKETTKSIIIQNSLNIFNNSQIEVLYETFSKDNIKMNLYGVSKDKDIYVDENINPTLVHSGDGHFKEINFKVKVEYIEHAIEKEFYKPPLIFDNKFEFKDAFAKENNQIKLVLSFEKDFILENITFKSIYGEKVNVKINNTFEKEFNLVSNQNLKITESKIII